MIENNTNESVNIESEQKSLQLDNKNGYIKYTEKLFHDLENKINESNTNIENKYNELCDKVSAIKIESYEIINKNFSNVKENLESFIEEKFTNEQENLKEENNKIISEISDKFDKLSSSLREQIENSLNQMYQKISSEMSLKSTELDNHKKEVESQVKSFINTRTTNIENILQQFNDQFMSHEEERILEYSNLKTQILSLLPQASAVGISKAYSDAKNAHEKSMTWYRRAYICTIIGMLALPFIAYHFGLITDFFELDNKEIGIQKFIFSAIRLAALELPLLWIANLMAKKIQQHQRIHEEYVHKYTAAMTFVGMSKEAKENTKIFGEDHVKKLTEGFRDAVYTNPSKTLDKEVKADSPIEIISSLVKEMGSEAVKTMVDNTKK